VSEAYYIYPVAGTRFDDEALQTWRDFLATLPTTPRRSDGAIWVFADRASADAFALSTWDHTEAADLVSLAPDVIEWDASFGLDPEPIGAFLRRFAARWPFRLDGPSANEMSIDDFVKEYRAVAKI
jgi:hypothetical protein